MMCNLHVDKLYNRFMVIRFPDQWKAVASFRYRSRVIEDDTISFLLNVFFRLLFSFSFVMITSSLCNFSHSSNFLFPFCSQIVSFFHWWHYKCTYNMNNFIFLSDDFAAMHDEVEEFLCGDFRFHGKRYAVIVSCEKEEWEIQINESEDNG